MTYSKSIFLGVLTLFGILLASTFVFSENTRKTDLQRIKDVHKIAELVEQFKAKTGHYPYQEAYLKPDEGFVPVPGGVTIHTGEVPKEYRYPPPGVSARIFPYNDFKSYLESILGPIDLPSDDRPLKYAPPYYITCYQYLFNGKAYFVSAVLESPNEYTKELAKGFYKYQVSSISAPDYKIYKYADQKFKY